MGVFGLTTGASFAGVAAAVISAAAGEPNEDVGTGAIGLGSTGTGDGVGTSGEGVGATGEGFFGGPPQLVRQTTSAAATNFDIGMAAL